MTKGYAEWQENSQESQVLLWHFTIPQLNNILVRAGGVGPLSTHKHPHLCLQVADGLQHNQVVLSYNNSNQSRT